jgi:hypothetical protein
VFESTFAEALFGFGGTTGLAAVLVTGGIVAVKMYLHRHQTVHALDEAFVLARTQKSFPVFEAAVKALQARAKRRVVTKPQVLERWYSFVTTSPMWGSLSLTDRNKTIVAFTHLSSAANVKTSKGERFVPTGFHLVM